MRLLLLRIAFWLGRIRVTGMEHLSSSITPTILLANCKSGWQLFALHLVLPRRIQIIVPRSCQQEIIRFIGTGRFVLLDTEDKKTLKRDLRRLQSSKSKYLVPLGLFGDTRALYRKVAMIARRTEALVFPVDVSGVCEWDTTSCGTVSWGIPKGHITIGEPCVLPAGKLRSIAADMHAVLQNFWFQLRYNSQVNIFDQLLVAVKKFGAKTAIAEDGAGVYTYKQILLGSYILGKKIDVLIGPQQTTVGVLLPTSAGHVIALFGLFFRGKTPAILNFSSGIRNVLDCAGLADVKSIITSRQFIEKAGLEPLVEQLATCNQVIFLEDVKRDITLRDKVIGLAYYLLRIKAIRQSIHQVILFTSGSESKPKGVVLRHTNLVANIHQLTLAIHFSPRDKMLSALPMFHSFGLTGGALLPLLGGIPVYLYPSPLHYKIIPELASAKKATILIGTPTFLMGYANNAENDDFSSMRLVVAGGEKLKDEVRALWREKFNIRLLEAYGTTEASPGLCVSSPEFHKDGSVGKFLPAITWRLAQVEGISEGGALQIQGPNVMEGYLLPGKGFVPVDAWYNCGDIVAVDDEGFCTIKARLKRFAKISGEMISLNQVEEIVEKCFKTDKNAAVSAPDPRKGEKIIVFTTVQSASRRQIREHLSETQQSMLLLPSDLVIVEELPLLGSGKIDYVTLQEIAASGNYTAV